MNNKLMEMRSHLFGVRTGTGMGRCLSASASASVALDVDNSDYDALIVSKQREIVRLVAEDTKNGNAKYGEVIRQKQIELNRLVSLKNQGRGAAFSDSP